MQLLRSLFYSFGILVGCFMLYMVFAIFVGIVAMVYHLLSDVMVHLQWDVHFVYTVALILMLLVGYKCMEHVNNKIPK